MLKTIKLMRIITTCRRVFFFFIGFRLKEGGFDLPPPYNIIL